MCIDIDNIIDKIIESLDFEENSYLGNKLGVDTDFSCVLDDMYPDRIAEMEEELGEALHNLFEGNLDKPITEHPDVQRLIGQVVELQAEIKGLKDLFKIVRARSMDYAHRTGEYHRDLSIIHESAVEALKGNTND